MLSLDLEKTAVLFGHDQRTGIIAVEPTGHFMRLFFRTPQGVHFNDDPFRPFILTSDPGLISGSRVPCVVRQLEGEERFRYQLQFENWGDCLKTRDYLASKTGFSQSSAEAPYLFISDLTHQYLLSRGVTLFKGIDFSEVVTLTLDIETFCAEGYQFSNPSRPEDRIISIALIDSRGEEIILRGDRLSEREMLLALNSIIQQNDPDVIIGHNIFCFDLDYIGKRAELLKIPLTWGRNGSTPRITPSSRWNLAERSIDYPRWDIYGRHIIDTYFLVLHYDITQRALASHSLKQVARHFGVAPPDRVYLEGSQICKQFQSDPEPLFRYNLDDARETQAIFRLLGYPWFMQTRIFPFSFQNCPIRGNATRINALFMREYLHRGHAIPQRTAGASPFEGGYTELLKEGLCGPVVHCDVASLYPSLMLSYQLKPARDSLGLFLPILAELRRYRLEAKQAARQTADDNERHYLETLQQVFKILINSFYGYLGATLHNFSDPETAAEVTRLGRVTIRNMLEALRREGAEPIEVDTDGIYFRPPEGCEDEEKQRALVERVSQVLPAGIEVEMDGRYRTMFSYKVKNYALLDYDGRIIIRGSSLKSRGLEPYLRELMKEAIALLLKTEGEGIEQLFDRYLAKLVARDFDISWVARTETLSVAPERYRAKVRSGACKPAAAFEIALKGERAFRTGDQVSYYICGNHKDVIAYENCRPLHAYVPSRPDVNIPYYIDKLKNLKKRFEPFLPKEPTLFDF